VVKRHLAEDGGLRPGLDAKPNSRAIVSIGVFANEAVEAEFEPTWTTDAVLWRARRSGRLPFEGRGAKCLGRFVAHAFLLAIFAALAASGMAASAGVELTNPISGLPRTGSQIILSYRPKKDPIWIEPSASCLLVRRHDQRSQACRTFATVS
jgi:hypothetical protein